MNNSALAHSLAGGLPFRRFELSTGKNHMQNFCSAYPM
jgi:hypothetical protein